MDHPTARLMLNSGAVYVGKYLKHCVEISTDFEARNLEATLSITYLV
jgi:hypothetical protein